MIIGSCPFLFVSIKLMLFVQTIDSLVGAITDRPCSRMYEFAEIQCESAMFACRARTFAPLRKEREGVQRNSNPANSIRRVKETTGRGGSDGSAASGGRSDLSEWQRSADEEGAPSPTKMPGTATGLGSNDYHCTVHAASAGTARQTGI